MAIKDEMDDTMRQVIPPVLLNYARDAYREELNDLLDDPWGLCENDIAVLAARITLLRQIGALVDIDFDGAIEAAPDDFERSRLLGMMSDAGVARRKDDR